MKIREILFEYNINSLIQNFNYKYELQKEKDHSNNFENLKDFILFIDNYLREKNLYQFLSPYMKWLVQKYVTGELGKYDDIMSKVIPGLEKYDFLKRKKLLKNEHKDINQIKNIHNFLDILDQYKDITEKDKVATSQKFLDKKFFDEDEAELFYEDDDIMVVIPKTEKASCYFGSETRWCTAATGGINYFETYKDKGDLYIVIFKKLNKKYQFHFGVNEFRDENDKKLYLPEIEKKYPKLKKIFAPEARKYNSYAFNVDKNNINDIIKEFEKNKINLNFQDYIFDYAQEFKNLNYESMKYLYSTGFYQNVSNIIDSDMLAKILEKSEKDTDKYEKIDSSILLILNKNVLNNFYKKYPEQFKKSFSELGSDSMNLLIKIDNIDDEYIIMAMKNIEKSYNQYKSLGNFSELFYSKEFLSNGRLIKNIADYILKTDNIDFIKEFLQTIKYVFRTEYDKNQFLRKYFGDENYLKSLSKKVGEKFIEKIKKYIADLDH